MSSSEICIKAILFLIEAFQLLESVLYFLAIAFHKVVIHVQNFGTFVPEYSYSHTNIGIKVWIGRSWHPILGIIACIACLKWTPKVYEPLSKDWNLYASIWQSSKYLSPCLKHWELTSNYWENMLIAALTLSLSFIFQKLGVNFQQTPESPAVFPNLC